MSYTPTTWINGSTKLSAANLNNIEAGIANAVEKPAGISAGEAVIWDGSGWARYDPASVVTATISGSNTDLTWGGGYGTVVNLSVTTAGGTLRSLGAPTAGAGTVITITNTTGTAFTVLNNPGGGSGVAFANDQNLNVIVNANGGYVQYVYDGSFWRQGSHSTPVWQPYTPAWTSDGTQPSLGNGALTGRYMVLGKHVVGQLHLTMGGTTTFGTGNYFFTLPPAAAAWGQESPMGSAIASDASGFRWIGVPCLSTSTTAFIVASASAQWTNTAPFTWVSTDKLSINWNYEAA